MKMTVNAVNAAPPDVVEEAPPEPPGIQTSRLLWYLVLRQTHARTLIVVVPLVCREWWQTARKVLSERLVPLVAPESVFRHCGVGVPAVVDQLLARLVYERRLSSSREDEAMVAFAMGLAMTEDVRVLAVKVLACVDASEGNARRLQTKQKLRHVSSAWFTLLSCFEAKGVESHSLELHSYFRLKCASGLVVGEESFSPPLFTALDCDALARECNLDGPDAFRTLVRACLVTPLQSLLFPLVIPDFKQVGRVGQPAHVL
jgi:hypothetical protein